MFDQHSTDDTGDGEGSRWGCGGCGVFLVVGLVLIVAGAIFFGPWILYIGFYLLVYAFWLLLVAVVLGLALAALFGLGFLAISMIGWWSGRHRRQQD